MRRTSTALSVAFIGLATTTVVSGQTVDSPMTRLQPLGAPSAVDQYRRPPQTAPVLRETAQRVGTLQAADSQIQLTQFDAPPLPGVNGGVAPAPGGFAPPPTTAPPATPVPIPQGQVIPQGQPQIIPQTQVLPPGTGTMVPVPVAPTPVPTGPLPTADYAPLAAPQLNDGFATIDNCNCVSGPSDYVSLTSYDCTPVAYQAAPVAAVIPAPEAYVAPPAQVAAPVVLPPAQAAGPVVLPPRQGGAPARSLVSFGQNRYPVEIGQGLFGQPVAYVPGQRFRNWIRYIFP